MRKKLLLKILITSVVLLLLSSPLYSSADTVGTLAPDASVTNTILVNDATPEVMHIYKITLPEDGKLHFTLKSDGTLFPTLNLLDADMKKSRGSAMFQNATGQTDLTCGGLAAGVYYIAVTQGQPYNHQTYSGSYVLSNSYEPIGDKPDALNDTKETAIAATLNTDIIGHLGYSYNNYRDTIDWYAINVTEEGSLKLVLDASNDLQVSVQLLDGDKLVDRGNVYTTKNPNDQKKEAIFDGLGKGKYYIRITPIEPYTNDFYYGLYTIDNAFTPAKYKNNKEPNEAKDSAVSAPQTGEILGNLGYLGNETRDAADWYYIDTENDGLLTLTLESTPGLHVNVSLLDGNESTELGSMYFIDTKSDILTCAVDRLAKGRYYLRVTPIEPSTRDFYFGSYKLTSSFKGAKYAPDDEQNNDRTKATPLTNSGSGTITGHVGYYYNGYFDPEDWYKLTITGTTLSLQLDRTPTEGIAFLVADANGSELKREDTTKVNKLELTGLKPGVYYIVAWPLSVHQNTKYCGSYSISYKTASATTNITKITPAPSVLTLGMKQKGTIKINALVSGAAPMTITGQCSFKVANSKIAKVDKNGTVTASTKGKTKVDVTYKTFKTSFMIIVK